ncbi:hypothetical protein [Cellvibrio polysaccharolyticus]|uniref:DUF2946 domain-containing protein n=1 Tax=Cellvibrio polysaccharolyticus TaxID=2082724 RepID=A0A928V3A3_9GAMM|nr:hypothetical protein [Cellvibrio polysaccharolyticus]MBE8717487.1 hypothetical protein [Cellvibrio polysaccharolyticus]
MRTPAYRQFLALLLCLWLPLQAAAGQWSPCHLLDMQTREASPVEHQHHNSGHSGCAEQAVDIEPSAPATETAGSCYHCQASCQFSVILLLPVDSAKTPFLSASNYHFELPFIPALLPDSLRRPPRLS